MDALEKEPLLINSRKNQDKKIFFEYKPLLNISRTNFDLLKSRHARKMLKMDFWNRVARHTLTYV